MFHVAALSTDPATFHAELRAQLDALIGDERDPIAHLLAVARGKRQPNAPSSLANNLIVTEILEAARESAKTQKRVTLK